MVIKGEERIIQLFQVLQPRTQLWFEHEQRPLMMNSTLWEQEWLVSNSYSIRLTMAGIEE